MSFLYKVGSKVYPKLKEVDDVLGGKAAWENVDSTQGKSYQWLNLTAFQTFVLRYVFL